MAVAGQDDGVVAGVEDDLGERVLAQIASVPVAGGDGRAGLALADRLGGEDAVRGQDVHQRRVLGGHAHGLDRQVLGAGDQAVADERAVVGAEDRQVAVAGAQEREAGDALDAHGPQALDGATAAVAEVHLAEIAVLRHVEGGRDAVHQDDLVVADVVRGREPLDVELLARHAAHEEVGARRGGVMEDLERQQHRIAGRLAGTHADAVEQARHGVDVVGGRGAHEEAVLQVEAGAADREAVDHGEIEDDVGIGLEDRASGAGTSADADLEGFDAGEGGDVESDALAESVGVEFGSAHWRVSSVRHDKPSRSLDLGGMRLSSLCEANNSNLNQMLVFKEAKHRAKSTGCHYTRF